VTGATVAQAVNRAKSINHLVQLTLMAAVTGAPLKAIAEADFAELPDLGPGLNDDPVWRHYLRRAQLNPACGLRSHHSAAMRPHVQAPADSSPVFAREVITCRASWKAVVA
jgi:hypothetical protein